MNRKAEGENAWARTRVRNQAVSSTTTQRFAHTGEKNRGKLEQEKTLDTGNIKGIEIQLPTPFSTILVKHSGWRVGKGIEHRFALGQQTVDLKFQIRSGNQHVL
jgi:hypothetical protein